MSRITNKLMIHTPLPADQKYSDEKLRVSNIFSLKRIEALSARVSFLSIELVLGGATKTQRVWHQRPCKNTLRAERTAGPDTSSVAPEAPAKALRKSIS